MPIFENRERLVAALNILSEHREEICRFYLAQLDLQVGNEENALLRNAFACSVSERRGASLERGQEAVDAFDQVRDGLFATLPQQIDAEPELAHRHLFEGLCRITNVDQKIAAMFLKFVVVYLQKWPQLQQHLFVPVDTVLLKILRNKLQVYVGPWTQSPRIKNAERRLYVINDRRPYANYGRFLDFQRELGDIADEAENPRILTDELWFIGHIFCKKYPLCNRCWIQNLCQEAR